MANIKFIADAHLGRVAKYLRALGYDTLFFSNIKDKDIIKISKSKNRVVLTKDRALCASIKDRCYLIKSKNCIDGLKEVVEKFNLLDKAKPFTICLKDNTLLQNIEKEKVINRLPERVKKFYTFFKICPTCNRIYWEGGHYKRMKRLLGSIFD